jgi:response regulator of citrate/malate metabolism
MDILLKQGREGIRLLREALEADPLQAAIVITAYSDMETFADALEAGALAYLDKKELLESFPPILIGRTVEEIIERGRMRRKSIDLESRLQSALRLLEQRSPENIHPTQITDYKRHLARSELALVESAIEAFNETRQTELAERLGYNDRYVFMRRIRKHFAQYPETRSEFSRVAEIESARSRKGVR